jgi:CTP synthase (UTP-ammonia lyase)
MLVLRAEVPVSSDIKRKIAYSCDVDEESVIVAEDAATIYQVPLNFCVRISSLLSASSLNWRTVNRRWMSGPIWCTRSSCLRMR